MRVSKSGCKGRSASTLISRSTMPWLSSSASGCSSGRRKTRVLPFDEALIVLDRIWDQFFLFANEADGRSLEAKASV